MSNTIFFFIFGLTVGILLSISLVSHYGRGHVPPKYNSEGLKVTESLTNVKEQNSNVDAPNVISASSPTVTSNPSSSESFWIPGREGSFLKFKNNNSAMNAESGSSRRDSNQGGNRKSSIRGKGGNYMGEVLKDQMKADIAKAIIPISSITKPQSAKVIEYKGGDNVEIQSKFYSDSGERIDLLSLAAKDPSLAGVRVHDHPPLVPYHSQAYQKNPLDPPYIPSLESVNKQRAAKLRRDPASSSKFSSLSR